MLNFDQSRNHVLVVTALPLESQAVLDQLDEIGADEVHPHGDIYKRGKLESWHVSIALTGAGNIAAAQATERAIQHTRPNLALFVGIAGGLKDVQLGDVVASKSVPAYEYGADRDTFQSRGNALMPSYPLVQVAFAVHSEAVWQRRIRAASQASQVPNSRIGPIAAGEKVVKSSRGAVAKLLRANFGDALAVEMEGAGFLHAAYASSLDAIVVRGISDLLDGKELADLHGSQEVAAANAAAFGAELLSKLWTLGRARVVAQAVGVPQREKLEAFFWSALRDLTPRLYPRGPNERDVWEDAGGDLASVNLNDEGRTQWSRALRLLEKGGGGVAITARALLSRMTRDFPNSLELAHLQGTAESLFGNRSTDAT